jgi:AcrR family transcriptional regulator
MSTKKRLTGPERRAQLITVGRSVFAVHGFEAISLEDIANRAGVTKPIIYEHFGGKEGLHAAIVEREMDDLVNRVTQGMSKGSPRVRFENAVVAFLTYLQAEPAGFAVLTREAPVGAARRGMTRVIDHLAQRVGEIFSVEFARHGYDRKLAPIYANALLGMVTQVGQWWAADGKKIPLDHVVQHICAIGWMGLRHLPKQPVKERKPARKRVVAKRDV